MGGERKFVIDLIQEVARKKPHKFVIIWKGISGHRHWHVFVEVTYRYIKSLAPGRFKEIFNKLISKLVLVIDGRGVSCEIALR